MLAINLITHPETFLAESLIYLEKNSLDEINQELILEQKQKQQPKGAFQSSEQKKTFIRQPDDMIIIRQLKGKSAIQDDDFSSDDEPELPQTFTSKTETDFTHKLQNMIQLTSYSDPIYAEAFVDSHKYDITFEILLINRTNQALQNVSIEFSTQGELEIIEKPAAIVLNPYQQAEVKTTIKLASSEAGLVFASINCENRAGIPQAYLITNEIYIDMTTFIYPEAIDLPEFRVKWQKYEWENRVTISTHFDDPVKYIQYIAKEFNMYVLTKLKNLNGSKYVSANLYACTQQSNDFLMNISIEHCEDKLSGFIRIRSQVKSIVLNLGEKLKYLQRK
eukprot:TRINITY_DN1383_c0_g1_i7.p1 TRINITY_DN1383_c0_g1~~TRINITY_DN1383_c0_g1_i7.p1  ORF type:complete len:335 (-),score=62.20 TRINITY_DN1383_c0_g1_i7:149-1153(-)